MAGYGTMYVPKRGQQRTHRLMFELVHGFLPEQVLHICDNPLCCNPEHLVNGTAQMNMDDCIRKGRLGETGKHLKNRFGEFCKSGHPLSGDNLKITFEKGYEKRRCKACARDRKTKYMATEKGRKKHNEQQLRRYHERKAVHAN